MLRKTRAGLGTVFVLTVVSSTVGGSPAGEDQVKNGNFDMVPPDIAVVESPYQQGTVQPTDWHSFTTNDPSGWDGVTAFETWSCQVPTVRDGGGGYAYGDISGNRTTASLGQIINGNSPDAPCSIDVGLWVFHATSPYNPDGGARIVFHQSDPEVQWESPLLRSTFNGTCFDWTWHEFSIPEDYGFRCGDISLTVELDTGAVAIPFWGTLRGIWVDGIGCKTSCPPPSPIPGDFDGDMDVDLADLAIFAACASGPEIPYDPQGLPATCSLDPDMDGKIAADFDRDNDVDQSDFAVLQRCLGGADDISDRRPVR